MRPVIETQELCRLYRVGDSEVCALDRVDVRIYAGEFVALMGPSGSGKSTLMHILGCLDRQSAGVYRLEGEEPLKMSDDRRAALRNTRIGFVFQNFNLLGRSTALENAALPLFYRQQCPDWRRRAAQALERVGLGHRMQHYPAQMSGGERQRVAIARALVLNPALILADEPTGNLDSARGAAIMKLLEELAGEGRTLLMVTHDAQIAACAQRVITMKDGRILADGPEARLLL